MPKLSHRCVALLLVPCLMADPVTTAALINPIVPISFQGPKSIKQTCFQEQAVVTPMLTFVRLSFARHRTLWLLTSANLISLVNSAYSYTHHHPRTALFSLAWAGTISLFGIQSWRRRRSYVPLSTLEDTTESKFEKLDPAEINPDLLILSDKEKTIRELDYYGVKIRGAHGLPTAYLEDALNILRRIKDKELINGLSIGMSRTMLLFTTFIGLGGLYLFGLRRLTVGVFPLRAVFRWVFAHELGHAMEDRKPELAKTLAAHSWTPVQEVSRARKILFLLEFTLASYFAFQLIYGWFSGMWPSMNPALLGVRLLSCYLFGMAMSFISGGMVRALIALCGLNLDKSSVFDGSKPWSILTLYSLTSRLEEFADLFATLIIFPDDLEKKIAHNEALGPKVALLKNELLTAESSEGLQRKSPAIHSWSLGWPGPRMIAVLFYIWTALSFAIERPFPIADTLQHAIFLFAVMNLLYLWAMRSIAALHIHLDWFSKRLPEAVRKVIRQSIASALYILNESQKLAIVALMLGVFLIIQNGLDIRYKPLEPIPVKEIFAAMTKSIPKLRLTSPYASVSDGHDLSSKTPTVPTPHRAKSNSGIREIYHSVTQTIHQRFETYIKELQRPVYKVPDLSRMTATPLVSALGNKTIYAPSPDFLHALRSHALNPDQLDFSIYNFKDGSRELDVTGHVKASTLSDVEAINVFLTKNGHGGATVDIAEPNHLHTEYTLLASPVNSPYVAIPSRTLTFHIHPADPLIWTESPEIANKPLLNGEFQFRFELELKDSNSVEIDKLIVDHFEVIYHSGHAPQDFKDHPSTPVPPIKPIKPAAGSGALELPPQMGQPHELAYAA
jgi:hypothetical protein